MNILLYKSKTKEASDFHQKIVPLTKTCLSPSHSVLSSRKQILKPKTRPPLVVLLLETLPTNPQRVDHPHWPVQFLWHSFCLNLAHSTHWHHYLHWEAWLTFWGVLQEVAPLCRPLVYTVPRVTHHDFVALVVVRLRVRLRLKVNEANLLRTKYKVK